MHTLREMRIRLAVLACLTAFMTPTTTSAENWPSWRGPHSNGLSADTRVPTEWSRDKNVAWRHELPGPAGATPVVWGDRLFLTSVDENQLVLLCMNTSGKPLWRRQISSGNKKVRGDEGNSASPSPVTDGKHVWAAMSNGAVACFDMHGKPVWNLNLPDRYGKFRIAFGMASTPVLHKGRLYFQLIHGDGKAATQEAIVVALDALTGKQVWKQARVTGAHSENEHSYASPMLYEDGPRSCLITHGADFAVAYNLKNGEELWRLGGLNPHDNPQRRYHPTLRFVASPAAAEGIVIVPTAKNGPVFAISADAKGDLTNRPHLWVRKQNTPDVPSPLIHDGLVYLCRENGNLLCLEAKTGKELYHERTNRGRHRSSPVYANGHIYLCSRDGKVAVVKAGRQFELVANNALDEELAASPAVANGTIYLRSFDALWAIRNQAETN